MALYDPASFNAAEPVQAQDVFAMLERGILPPGMMNVLASRLSDTGNEAYLGTVMEIMRARGGGGGVMHELGGAANQCLAARTGSTTFEVGGRVSNIACDLLAPEPADAVAFLQASIDVALHEMGATIASMPENNDIMATLFGSDTASPDIDAAQAEAAVKIADAVAQYAATQPVAPAATRPAGPRIA